MEEGSPVAVDAEELVRRAEVFELFSPCDWYDVELAPGKNSDMIPRTVDAMVVL